MATTAPPLPSAAESALRVQQNLNDELAAITDRLRSLRFRMRAAELSTTSLRAASTAHRTKSRLGDVAHECARLREPLDAIEWRVAL
jgi:hypothetical protein